VIEKALESEIEGESGNNERVKAIFIVYLSLFSVILFNKFVMGHVLHMIVHHEKHDNKTTAEFSFAIKYSFGMFFTTALMTLAVEAI